MPSRQLTRPDRLSYNAFFGLFPAHVRQSLVEKAETRLYKPKEVIFHKDDEGPWLAAILAGRVRIAREMDDDREMLITIVERDQIFGERSFYDGLPRSATATAIEDTAVQIFHRNDLLPALYAYPETLMHVIRTMCNRLYRYVNTMELYALCSLEVKMASQLLLMAQKYGQPCAEGLRLSETGLNQSDIASHIASSRESVNRQLKIFESKGLIALKGNEITLLKPDVLAQICDEPFAAPTSLPSPV